MIRARARRASRRLVPAVLCLAATGVWAQTGRVDTELRLKMSERLGDTAAQDARVPAAPAEPPAGNTPGPLLRGLSLRLTSGVRIDDNVLRTGAHPRRDTVVVLKPAIYWNGRIGRHDLRLGYEGDVARYQRLSSENFWNHKLLSAADLDLGRRLKARLEGDLEYGTDPRGDLTSRPFNGSGPDRWRAHHLAGEITLGRRIAQAQVSARAELRGRRYLNNGQEIRDLDEHGLVLNGRYNLGPRFALISRLSGSWVDYLSAASPLDSHEYTALGGVAWEATVKTRGQVLLGVRRRNFDDPSRPDVSGLGWDAQVNWSPRSYSQVTLYTSREVTESGFGAGGTGASGTATTDVYGVRWRHGLSNRLTFDAGVQRAASTFDAGGEDEFMHYAAGLRYRLNRWVDLFGSWDLETRSSSPGGAGYEAGSVFIGFDTHLEHRPGN